MVTLSPSLKQLTMAIYGSESPTFHQKNIYTHLTSLGQTFQALDKFLGHDESHSMEQATVSLWESALL